MLSCKGILSCHSSGILSRTFMKNFHLPLPEQTYAILRAQAERMQVPATALAREAIDQWVRSQLKKERHEAIEAFAKGAAGTHADLDPDLESAGIEHLLDLRKKK